VGDEDERCTAKVLNANMTFQRPGNVRMKRTRDLRFKLTIGHFGYCLFWDHFPKTKTLLIIPGQSME